MCFLFQIFSTFSISYPRGIARGLMAGVAQRDVKTISNQSGDTFLLSDVDTDFPSVSENPDLELSSEPQTAEQQAVSAPGNISYAAAAADNTPRVNENPRGYRGEQYLTRFEKETSTRTTSHRSVHALLIFKLLFLRILRLFSTL